MTETAIVARRFNGPPGSGNGGYCCGLVAGLLGGPATATLKAPPPLETPLDIQRHDGGVRLMRDGAVIAEAVPAAAPSIAPPGPVSLAEATAASARYPSADDHYFPTCFVCGPSRAAGDGLRIFAGAAGPEMVAAPWTPDPSLAAADGLVAAEHVWAALDCPSYFAFQKKDLPALLGRLTVAIERRPAPGDALIVAAWPLRSEGRKHFSAAALLDGEGAILARAEALWIELKPDALAAMKAAV